MAVKRLTEEHPVMKKVRELEALADKLGLTIESGYGGQINISDGKNSYQYRDVEQTIFSHESTTYFPYCAETKLICEDE